MIDDRKGGKQVAVDGIPDDWFPSQALPICLPWVAKETLFG